MSDDIPVEEINLTGKIKAEEFFNIIRGLSSDARYIDRIWDPKYKNTDISIAENTKIISKFISNIEYINNLLEIYSSNKIDISTIKYRTSNREILGDYPSIIFECRINGELKLVKIKITIGTGKKSKEHQMEIEMLKNSIKDHILTPERSINIIVTITKYLLLKTKYQIKLIILEYYERSCNNLLEYDDINDNTKAQILTNMMNLIKTQQDSNYFSFYQHPSNYVFKKNSTDVKIIDFEKYLLCNMNDIKLTVDYSSLYNKTKKCIQEIPKYL